MKSVADAARQGLNSSTRPQPGPSLGQTYLPAELKQAIRRLFARMKGAYGHVWSSRFTSPESVAVAMADWAKQLRDCTPAQIDQAFERCLAQHRLPPTLPEFLAILRPEPIPAAHRPLRLALPKPPQDPEAARQAIAECRRILAGVRGAQEVSR